MRFNTKHISLCCAQAAVFASLSNAQVADATYSIEHNFNYMPAGDVVGVVGSEFRHVWIRTLGIFGDAWSAQALPQDPLFDPFGTDTMGIGSFAINSGLGMPVPCVYNTFNIPPAGINFFQCIILPLDQSFSDACTEFFVASYSLVPPISIQGRIASSGGVHAFGARCYAYSSAGISIIGTTQLANGTIVWNPVITDVVGGGVLAEGLHQRTDPVHIVANNLDTGDQIDASLFGFTMDSAGLGTIQWDGGILEIDRPDFELVLDIPSTYIAPGQSGSAELVIENGIVTVSNDSGIFDGLLPLHGEITPLSFPFPNDFALDYDLNLDPTFNWEVVTDLSGGAGTLGEAICHADLNGDGELNFFDISLFLELFTDRNPLADFNGDKEFNFFDVSAFLSAFSQGCDGK